MVGCLNYLDRVMITTMHNSLKEAIPMTDAQFGLLTTAFLVVYAVLSPIAGFLADRFGRSRVIIGSLLVWSLITALTARANTYDQLLATRLLMGISETCYLPAALALTTDYHRGATRSRANGILLGGVMVGSGLSGMGGWLAERYGWEYPFILFGLVGIGYSVVLALLLRDLPRKGADAIAPTEAIQEVRLGEAVMSLFSRSAFIFALIYWGLLSISSWMVVGWMPTYIGENFHLAQGAAGLLTTVYSNAATLLGLIVGGAWADRWSLTHEHACIFVSVIGLCAGVPCIFLVWNTSLLPLAIAGLALFGLTTSFANTEIMPILCLITDPRYNATGMGIMNLFGALAGGVTIYAGGVLRDAQVNVIKLFQLGAVGLVLGTILLFFVKPRTRGV
jgi:MFS family permease